MKHIEDCKKHPIDQSHICCEDQMCPCDYEEFQRLFTENTQLREALEEIREFAHTSTKDATWIEERARAALEEK